MNGITKTFLLRFINPSTGKRSKYPLSNYYECIAHAKTINQK